MLIRNDQDNNYITRLKYHTSNMTKLTGFDAKLQLSSWLLNFILHEICCYDFRATVRSIYCFGQR